MSTRAVEYSSKKATDISPADVAAAFDVNLNYHHPARVLEITKAFDRFIETLKHAGELFSKDNIPPVCAPI